MSEALIKEMLEQATLREERGELGAARALRGGVRRIKELEEQLKERDARIAQWEFAANRWVETIDRLSKALKYDGPIDIKVDQELVPAEYTWRQEAAEPWIGDLSEYVKKRRK